MLSQLRHFLSSDAIGIDGTTTNNTNNKTIDLQKHVVKYLILIMTVKKLHVY
jgi:hypothetical protein